MLRARATSPFSQSYEILAGDAVLTTVRLRWLREAGGFDLDGVAYQVGRRGLASGAFFLEQSGRVLATAQKPSLLLRRFEVQVGPRAFVLAARSPLQRAFDLTEQGRVVGAVEPASLFTRSANIDLPRDLPLAVRVFLTWLVLVLWRRQRSSASSS